MKTNANGLDKDFEMLLRTGKAIEKRQYRKEHESAWVITITLIIAALLLALGILSIFLVATAHAQTPCPAIDMNKIMMIESSGNPRAFNPNDNSVGLFQITPICLEEANRLAPDEIVGRNCTGINYLHLGAYCERRKLTQDDLFNPLINTRIAKWYLTERIPAMIRYYKKPVTVENILISYNAGISYVVQDKPLPKITKDYLRKYFK